MKPGRAAGSCRFETYYKTEVWDPVFAAWRPIQKAHGSELAARAAVKPGQRGRITEISTRGRKIGEPFDA